MILFSAGRDLNHITYHMDGEKYMALLFVLGEMWGGTPMFQDMARALIYGR